MSKIIIPLPVASTGGCASKLSIDFVDKTILASTRSISSLDLIVGPETKDDAAVYKLNERQALISSLDYSTPICSDPDLFGRISAANSLSDIYAMGGRPIVALSILGAPEETAHSTLLSISTGAADMCSSVGVPIAGGHSALNPEVIYGLSVTGLCHPDHIVRNCRAEAGDMIILTKPLGVGVYARSFAQLGGAIEEAWRVCLQVNSVGAELAEAGLVSAMTDVTGFGLLCHLFEMAQGSHLAASIISSDVPVLPACRQILENGDLSGAGAKNYATGKSAMQFGRSLKTWQRMVMFEPETNGGLLLSVRPDRVEASMAILNSAGFANAAIIGTFDRGPTKIRVT